MGATWNCWNSLLSYVVSDLFFAVLSLPFFLSLLAVDDDWKILDFGMAWPAFLISHFSLTCFDSFALCSCFLSVVLRSSLALMGACGFCERETRLPNRR